METNKIKATIFIPTYNGEKYLKQILNGIFGQKVDFDYEVLIIDSGSSDDTLPIIRKFLDKHDNLRLHEIPNSEFGHGKTRNLAAQMAKGEIIVYLSHDAIPAHKRWLHEMVKPFEISPKIVGVMGKQIPRPKCFPLLKYEILHVFNQFGPDYGTTVLYKDDFVKSKGVHDAISFYSDVNSAAPRDFLLNKIPYRDVKYSEDMLYGRDVIEAGYYKVYAARGSVVHSNDMLLREYKKRMFDETLALRKAGIARRKLSLGAAVKLTLRGTVGDTLRIIKDKGYSWKRKLYWLVVNPFFHVEKWRGVYTAHQVDLHDEEEHIKNSLEYQNKR